MRKIKNPWTPIDIARVNNQVVRMALFKGQYHWHSHKKDELFYVLNGTIKIRIRNSKDIKLSKGEMVVVPKGVEHCTESKKGAYVLMFEPSDMKSFTKPRAGKVKNDPFWDDIFKHPAHVDPRKIKKIDLDEVEDEMWHS